MAQIQPVSPASGGKPDSKIPPKRGVFTQALIVFGGLIALLIIFLIVIMVRSDRIFRYTFLLQANQFSDRVELDRELTALQYQELKRYAIALLEYLKYEDLDKIEKVARLRNLSRTLSQALADKHLDGEDLMAIREAVNESGVLQRRRSFSGEAVNAGNPTGAQGSSAPAPDRKKTGK